MIIITAKFEKFSRHSEKQFKYPTMREEFDAKTSPIGKLMVACQNYMGSAKVS